MVSQSDWFGSWPLLVPQKVNMYPNMDPKSDILGPQNANNSTWCRSSSKRKFDYNSPDILLYLTPNKVHISCFGVLTSIKKVFAFMLRWKRTKRPLGDLKRPNKSRRRHCWTMLGPKSKSRGAQHRPLERQKTTKRLQKGMTPNGWRRLKTL